MWDSYFLAKAANQLIFFSLFLMLIGGVHYCVHLPGLFPLHSVLLSTKPQRVVPQEVLQAVRSNVNGNFLTINLERVRQSIEKLHWVRKVNISRKFPDQLIVSLEEHQAIARWNNNALVNTYGEVFSVASSDELLKDHGSYGSQGNIDKQMPLFFGQQKDSQKIVERYLMFSQQLAPLNIDIVQVALSQRQAWQLRLSNGMVLELGRDNMQQRLALFVAAYPISLSAQAGNVHYVDMRYRNGFAVSGG
jgi:cell division protein FtsQ